MKNQILLTFFLLFSVFFIGLANISAQEGDSKAVSGGGVLVKGWTGKIDAKEQAAGLTLNSAKLAQEGKALHVTTGPAVTYWNRANVARGEGKSGWGAAATRVDVIGDSSYNRSYVR